MIVDHIIMMAEAYYNDTACYITTVRLGPRAAEAMKRELRERSDWRADELDDRCRLNGIYIGQQLEEGMTFS